MGCERLARILSRVATRNGNRGCLMCHFVDENDAEYGEVGAVLLEAEMEKDYNELQTDNGKSKALANKAFEILGKFSYFPVIKNDFINMIIFDILIGNQDSHPYNWQVLFNKDNSYFFAHLYDNGTSLGWQLDDSFLEKLISNESKMNQFFKKTRLKAGMLGNTTPKIKIQNVIRTVKRLYPAELMATCKQLEEMNMGEYSRYIEGLPLISDIRKIF